MRCWPIIAVLLLAGCDRSADPGVADKGEDAVAKAERAAISDTDAARRDAATTAPPAAPGTN